MKSATRALGVALGAATLALGQHQGHAAESLRAALACVGWGLVAAERGAPLRADPALWALALASRAWELGPTTAAGDRLRQGAAAAADLALRAAGIPSVRPAGTARLELGGMAPVTVQVTSLCVGGAMLLAHLTLGALLAAALGLGRRDQLIVLCMSTVGGLALNVVRIVAVAWAATRIVDPGAWACAHDLFGAAIFGGGYAALARWAWGRRPKPRRRHAAASMTAAAGASAASPSHTKGVRRVP